MILSFGEVVRPPMSAQRSFVVRVFALMAEPVKLRWICEIDFLNALLTLRRFRAQSNVNYCNECVVY